MPGTESADIDVSGDLHVTLYVSRWTARLEIADPAGNVRTWMLSADSYLTEHDRIWFGTHDEFKAALGH